MRVTSGLLLAAALFAGCAAPAPPPRPAWTPPPEAAALAARLGSGDPAARAAAEADLAALDEEARCTALRAGLLLPDGPAAVACAARLPWERLDEGESARCVALLGPGLFRPGWPGDFEEFRSYLGSEDLGAILEGMPERPVPPPGYDSMAGPLSALHRVVRPEHLPALCRLARSPDEGVRDGAWDCIQTTIRFTDRHREEVARTAMAFWQDRLAEGAELPPEDGRGYPEILRALLRGCFVEGRGDRPLEALAVRWAAEAAPADEDAPLLLEMLEREIRHGPAPTVFVRALGRLGDPASLAWLRGRAADAADDGDLLFPALSALARRGEPASLDALEAAAGDSDLAWRLLAEQAPERAGALLRDMLLRGGPGVPPDEALDFLEDALESAEREGIRIPSSAFAGLERAALAAGLDGASLARAAVTVPGCRTRRLARAAVDALRREGPPADPVEGTAGRRLPERGEAAFLEVAAPEEFRALLREWAAAEPGGRTESVDWALAGLLALGDPPSGPRLAPWVGEGRGSAVWEGAPLRLARSPCPEVEAALRAMALGPGGGEGPDPAEALGGLAALHGVPGDPIAFLARGWAEPCLEPGLAAEVRRLVLEGRPRDALAAVLAARPDLDLPGLGTVDDPRVRGWAKPRLEPGLAPEVRRLVLEGRPRDALAAVLAARPDLDLPGLGAVDDPRVRAHLEGLRIRRAPGRYRYATEQLAVAGDPAAREELLRAHRRGRYRWIDEGDEDALTLGRDLATIPFWIEELEGSCCRSYKPDWLLDRLFDYIPSAAGTYESSVVLPAARARRWWAEHGPRMAWSRIADAFVPGPVE